MESNQNPSQKNWVEVTEPLAAIQNLINGCLIAQSRGAYSLEDSSALWDSIKYLIALQSKLREENKTINDILQEELAKPEDESTESTESTDSEVSENTSTSNS
jgi:hypothetical protein